MQASLQGIEMEVCCVVTSFFQASAQQMRRLDNSKRQDHLLSCDGKETGFGEGRDANDEFKRARWS